MTIRENVKKYLIIALEKRISEKCPHYGEVIRKKVIDATIAHSGYSNETKYLAIEIASDEVDTLNARIKELEGKLLAHENDLPLLEASKRIAELEEQVDHVLETGMKWHDDYEKLAQETRWIPVDEKLPELDSWVEVYAGNFGYMGFGHDGFSDWNHSPCNNIFIPDITHWRIPKGPTS
jgi:outer membrane murein-binding lipoprotein Lpp